MKNESCFCSRSDGLFISNRSISAIVMGGLIFMMGAFSIGYFYGKQFSIDQYTARVEQESFADQIYTSLCTIYDQNGQAPDDIASEYALEQDEPELSSELVDNQGDLDQAKLALEQEHMSVGESEPELEVVGSVAPQAHYAQLIGFGTKGAAEQFVQKMNRKHIPVKIQTRNSKTAKGKKIAWYQVVTEPHVDYAQLEDLVDRIAKEERIKGIKIVRC